MGTHRDRSSTLRFAAPAMVAIGLVAGYVTLRSPVPAYPPASEIAEDNVQGHRAPVDHRVEDGGSAPLEPSASTPAPPPHVGDPTHPAAPPTDAADEERSGGGGAQVAGFGTGGPGVIDDGEFRSVPATGSIRDVNLATVEYPVRSGRPGRVGLVDGVYEEGDPGTDDYLWVEASAPIYGDLNGDGVDEAAVQVRSRQGTAERAHSTVWVFTVQGDRVVALAQTPSTFGPDRPAKITIDGGVLSLTIVTGGGDSLSRSTIHYRYISDLAPIDPRPSITWQQIGAGSQTGAAAASQPQSVVFQPNTTSAIVVVDPSVEEQRFRFDASGGQVLRARSVAGSGAALRVYNESTRLLVGELRPDRGSAEVALRSNGGYIAYVIYAAEASDQIQIELAIAEPRVLAAPTWEPRAAWRQLDDGAGVLAGDARLAWPYFPTVSTPFETQAVNQAIVDFVAVREEHGEQQLSLCSDDAPRNYRLTYTPTLVSYDLISIRFSELVSGCAEANSFGYHGLTIDLNTGQVLTVRDLFEDRDASALAPVWWNHVGGIERSYPIDEADIGGPVAFAGFSISPDGIWLDADASGLSSGPSWPTFLDFESLEGVIDVGVSIRANSGRALTAGLTSCNC